jgi:hypothetical protein
MCKTRNFVKQNAKFHNMMPKTPINLCKKYTIFEGCERFAMGYAYNRGLNM